MDYRQSALEDAMADHRYDAQLVIYTLALHRFLKQKLGERYSYQTHIGGGLYLFLRGMHPTYGSETGIIRLKPEQALIEALDELFGGCR